MKENSHLDIWYSFKQGNWECYASLYNIYYKTLNNYGYKFTPDSELIEDAIHDLFVRLWTTRERIGNPVSVKNYLFKSLRNILYRKLKRQGKARPLSSGDEMPDFDAFYITYQVSNLENKEMQDAVKNIVNSLPPRQQEIIYLRFYEGLKYEEIADIMGISIGSTYKLFYKAIDSLQQTIGTSLLTTLLFSIT